MLTIFSCVCLPSVCLLWRNVCLGLTSSSYNSMIEKETTQSKSGKRPDISPKKTHKWLTNTWKDVQHCLLLEKCKSKLQWDISSHWSKWPLSKSLQTINAAEAVEKRECSQIVGGNVNWYSHYEDGMEIPSKTRNKHTIWPRSPNPRHITWGNQNWKKKHVSHCSLQHYLQ